MEHFYGHFLVNKIIMAAEEKVMPASFTQLMNLLLMPSSFKFLFEQFLPHAGQIHDIGFHSQEMILSKSIV